MAKISFDIKYRPQIESGEYKVETRDGRRARIICWDKIDDNHPIIALVPFHGMEESIDYTNKGQYFREGEMTEDDLFIVTPEEEMTEFEMAIHRRLNLMNGENLLATELLEETKAMAAELLELAKKEIGTTFDKAGEYLRGRNEGIAEALKDLPRWKKCDGQRCIPDSLIQRSGLYAFGSSGQTGDKFILLRDLEKLPKED